MLLVATGCLIAGAGEADMASPAISSDTVRNEIGTPLHLNMPVELTGRDLVTKVYGVLSPAEASTEEDCKRNCKGKFNLTPSEDEYGLWLEDKDGYSVNCYGIKPETSAMAGYEDGQLAKYGFFFLFPYKEGERESANRRQATFCGSLLQELKDMGLTLSAASDTPVLFDVIGENGGDSVEIRLVEETESTLPDNGDRLAGTEDAQSSAPQSGRFILILSVEPGTAEQATL